TFSRVPYTTLFRSVLSSLNKRNLRNWNRTAFLALARLQVNQRALDSDLDNAVRYFEFAEKVLEAKFKPTDYLLYLEALGDLHRFDDQTVLAKKSRLADKYPIQALLLELNAIQHEYGISPAWLHKLNTIYS